MSERGREPPDPQKLEQRPANAKAIESQEIPPTDWSEVPTLLSDLYRVVNRLENVFPGRRFTPAGHLVGSIGEVLAEHIFGLKLHPPSTPKHDAITTDGILVQIKLTQGNRIALTEEPQHLLVLKLNSDLSIEYVYNGRGTKPWSNAGRRQKNGQRQISLSKLRKIDEDVSNSDRLPKLNEVNLHKTDA